MIIWIAVGWTFGVWLLQQQAYLPDQALRQVLLGFALALGAYALSERGRPRALAWAVTAAIAGILMAAYAGQQRLAQSLPAELEGVPVVVQGVITDLPVVTERGTRFMLDMDQPFQSNDGLWSATKLSLTWYGKAPALRSGDAWRLVVKLKRPHAAQNPGMPDMQAWWLEHGVVATGYVRERGELGEPQRLPERYQPLVVLDRWREQLRQAVLQQLGQHEQIDVLLALAIGDQAAIDRSSWTLFQRTGVAHLMSISGLHVTMIAKVGHWLASFLWRRHRRAMQLCPTQQVGALAGALTALFYAGLAGFGVPAVRTALMVSVVAVATLTAWRSSFLAVIGLALLVVTLVDPWAVLSAGFWLSFLAVALLVMADAALNQNSSDDTAPEPTNPQDRSRLQARLAAAWPTLRSGVSAQLAVTVGLAPLGVLLFAQFSVISPIANAFAIPIVSFWITPLALLGCLTALIQVSWPLYWAGESMAYLMQALQWVDGPWSVYFVAKPTPALFALALGGQLLLFWPTQLPWANLRARVGVRLLGLLPLVWLMWGVRATELAPGAVRLLFVDVGQGSAVYVQTAKHHLLYDTGPAFGPDVDAGDRVLVPMLRAQGVHTLNALVLSHEDMDHAGGANSVLRQLNVEQRYSSMSAPHPFTDSPQHQHCEAGLSWSWDGIAFRFLHPQPATDYRDNNARSCVLELIVGGARVLLTGDLPAEQESILVQNLATSPTDLPTKVMLVPHHGSKTSSSEAFLDALKPELAVIQVGYRSRYGHPHPRVMARYNARQIPTVRTDLDGAITVDLSATGHMAVRRERVAAHRYWMN